MSEIRFDERVAIITGAAGSLGREYAKALAERGARVLVNDLGCDMVGQGADASPAEKVADEIVGLGGIALANTDSVTTREGAEAMISQAVEAWGRVDILINNAGNVTAAGNLKDVTDELYDGGMDVSARGTFNTMRAAWPLFLENDYGRIVNASSGSVFGMGSAVPYPASKAEVLGMTRTIAAAMSVVGRNIKVNAIMPVAHSRLTALMGAEIDAQLTKLFPASSVAPVVAWLSHEDVPVNGECFTVGGGRFARVFLGVTDGYRGPADLDVETVRDHFDEAMDMTDFHVPERTRDESELFTHEIDWAAFDQITRAMD